MKKNICELVAGIFFCGFLSSCFAQKWIDYQNDTCGIQMKIPETMRMVKGNFGQGYSGIKGELNPVTIYAMAKGNGVDSLQNILSCAATLTGVPLNIWQLVDQGTNAHGLTKWRVYQASNGTKLVFTLLGNGSASSRIILIGTTVNDYTANKAAYTAWYNSVNVIPILATTPSPQVTTTQTDSVQTTTAPPPAPPKDSGASPKSQKGKKAQYQ
jgi:hypothetical protein